MRYHRLIRAAVALAVFVAGLFAVFQAWEILRSSSSSAAVSLQSSSLDENIGPIVLTERVELSPTEGDEGSPNPWMTMTLSPPASIVSKLNHLYEPLRIGQSSIDWMPFRGFTVECDIPSFPHAPGAIWNGLGSSGSSVTQDGKVSGFKIDTSKSKDIFDGNLMRDTCIITVLDMSCGKEYRVTAACDIELMKTHGNVRPVAASVTWRGPTLVSPKNKPTAQSVAHEKSSN